MKTAWRFGFVACVSVLGAFVYACGSDSGVSIPGGDDGGGGADGSTTDGGGNAGNDSGGGGADSGQDAGGVPCAPPSDPKKAALCIVVDHETIAFLANDPRFDGLGAMIAQVFVHAVPDFPDGGEEPALATVVLPNAVDGGGDAGEFDLKSQTANFRFEVTPGTIHPRVFFIDNPTSTLAAGWWVAGLDFSNGIKANMPLGAHKLAAGDAKGVRMNLTALRDLVVTVGRSVTPSGNGQGVTTIYALDTNTYTAASKGFGVAQGCTNLEGADASATVEGFVVGKGPYFLSTALDDFDVGDASTAGYMVSATSDSGALVIPPANKTTYPANAYVVTQAVDLNLVFPKPVGADKKTCP
jgi:hypothetical protein